MASSCFLGRRLRHPRLARLKNRRADVRERGSDGRSSRTRSSPLSRIFDDQDRRRPMPRHGDLASPADDPVRAPAATAAPSAIAGSPRPRDRMGPHRRARLAQRRRRRCLRAGHGTNVSGDHAEMLRALFMPAPDDILVGPLGTTLDGRLLRSIVEDLLVQGADRVLAGAQAGEGA
jgi:hypothetical protein